jgi:hypothetical protein
MKPSGRNVSPSEPAPFRLTPQALNSIASVLWRHPGMQPALLMQAPYEIIDDKGSVETQFEYETFWIAHDTADKFSNWPKINLCGQTIPIEPGALKRLNGTTLASEAREVIIGGEKEMLELLVLA